MATGPEHYREAERLIHLAEEQWSEDEAEHDAVLRNAQVHATLSHAAAADRLAQAVENLPSYEGMLAVYNFGGGK